MKLMRFEQGGDVRLGAVSGEEVVPLSDLQASAPDTMQGVIEAGPALVAELAAALETHSGAAIPLGDVRPLIPVERPGKVICLGLNYADHAREGGHEVPDYPSLFMRVSTSLIAAGEPLVRPRACEQLDYEAELMIVIGARCRHLSEEGALDPIFGYTVFNDGSVRAYQRRTSQWTAGKNFDATGPIGPWIVTADELPPGARGLRIRSMLGERTLQDANTSSMIFDVARTVSILSEIMTLEPGDLIATGTPEGVGHARRPQLWLKPGDTIDVEIEGIGRLSNPVVDEQVP